MVRWTRGGGVEMEPVECPPPPQERGRDQWPQDPPSSGARNSQGQRSPLQDRQSEGRRLFFGAGVRKDTVPPAGRWWSRWPHVRSAATDVQRSPRPCSPGVRRKGPAIPLSPSPRPTHRRCGPLPPLAPPLLRFRLGTAGPDSEGSPASMRRRLSGASAQRAHVRLQR